MSKGRYDNDEMPFGKHRGTKMANVPAQYLKYIYDEGIVSIKRWNDVYWYIRDNMDAIEKELNEQKS
ncbi:putative quorum-sensing-regulated virulence factor [Carboxylicivirga marina]|uniref:DUF3820 family protein n=1 Tax=Carboxylicivirga marina TaxID=2800988 RepID=A0ABS1HG86_9BACT|nr:DUF3820 family protein [Carboxylicivirga marina]MBK3516685.1 DUF3820 family protein [Carboxylicivirga marina]